MKFTIAIPNFNGQELLKKNLPNILNGGADEVLVIDDKSSDDSVEVLKKEFSKVRLLENKVNLGFISTVNKLFDEALGEVVVLLNSDVWVEKDFLKPLYPHFKNNKVFAVNLHEKGAGPAVAFWKDGFFQYQSGLEKNVLQKSSWASGGSAAYSKKLWQRMGGFDKLFDPFYFEDLDLSFRAIKAGLDILWEPNSIVYHQHESTISKTFSKRYVDWVKQRNQLLFIWKNIKDPKLIKDHKKNLLKRLFGGLGIGYWIPFLWALLKIPHIKHNPTQEVLSDQEAIDYAIS